MDDLGDRMKDYEALETTRALDPRLPIYARLDGRSFSRFTKAMIRPFDERLSAAMVETTRQIVAATNALVGYTQSDEMSYLWQYEGEDQPLFGGKVHKLTSVLASLAAAAFHQELGRAFGDLEGSRLAMSLPHFDARVLQLPSRTEAANMMLWRALDARKNAVASAAQHTFSPSELHGKSEVEMLGMLEAAGIDFEAFPARFRIGTFLRRIARPGSLSEAERERIPEQHRPPPGTMFVRHTVEPVDVPELRKIANRVEVLFMGAEPVLLSTEFNPARALAAYHDALDRRDLLHIGSLLADGARYRSKGLGDVVGREAILAALTHYFDVHPNHRAWDEGITRTGPNAARSRWQLTATNRLTGVAIERSGVETVTFDADGRVALVESIDD